MKLLVLGANGMLGHELVRQLNKRHEIIGTVRKSTSSGSLAKTTSNHRIIEGVDANNFKQIEDLINLVRPDCVVNCIGIIKQIKEAKDPVTSITINALFPQKLALYCTRSGIRLVHVSTDCVFSGARGSYVEHDLPDPQDLYGRTKLLGEVEMPGCLTLRTSIIGRELHTCNGLVEWFIKTRESQVPGYTGVPYNGLTTTEFSRVLERVLMRPDLSGLLHVSSETITKYELLKLIKKIFNLSTEVIPVNTPKLNRSLDSTRIRALLNYTPPTWESMVNELMQETRISKSDQKTQDKIFKN